MNHLQIAVFAFTFLISAGFSFGNACLDSSYVRLGQLKMSEITASQRTSYLQLDSLCKSDTLPVGKTGAVESLDSVRTDPGELDEKGESRASAKEAFLDRRRQLPNSSESGKNGQGKSKGRGWYWASLAIGSIYFLGSSVFMSTIDDDCELIFVTDFLKSEEQCKEDAKEQRKVAGFGMLFGGILSLIGGFGLLGSGSGE